MSYPITFPSKVNDDFFPYLDGPHSSWAGYFSSRPALKGYVRDSGSLLQAAAQLLAFAPTAATAAGDPLGPLERAVGVTQHHDAVSGTAQQHVSDDYAMRLAAGRAAAEPAIAASLSALTGAAGTPFALCDLANVTICPALEAGSGPLLLALYNSQGHARPASPVLLAVGFPPGVASYAVLDPAGAPVTAQLLPLSADDARLRTAYYSTPLGAPLQWLAFQAALPPAGFAVYFLVPAPTAGDAPHTHASVERTMALAPPLGGAHAGGGGGVRGAPRGATEGDQTLTNGVLTLTISGASGLLAHYAHPAAGIDTPLSQQFLWYNASAGDALDSQASGAYIFRPVTGSAALPLAAAAAAVTLLSGPVLSEARQVLAVADVGAAAGVTWARQSVRLWAGAPDAELEFALGPLPFADGWGKEVISRVCAPLATGGAFATDSNGRDLVARARNYRKYFPYNDTEPIAANYFPVNSQIETSDPATGVTLGVVNDRSQGGSSLQDGCLELLVHRRLLHDDGRGVGEPLNETGLDGNGLVVKGVHRLAVNPRGAAAAWRRAAAQDVALFRPLAAFAPLPPGATPASWLAAGHRGNWSGVTAALPPNVHLLTVAPAAGGATLVRLAHMFGVGEDAALSANATVALGGLFTALPAFGGCAETTLPGTQPLGSVAARLPAALGGGGPSGGGGLLASLLARPPSGEALEVALAALEIRTFLCSPAAAAAGAV